MYVSLTPRTRTRTRTHTKAWVREPSDHIVAGTVTRHAPPRLIKQGALLNAPSEPQGSLKTLQLLNHLAVGGWRGSNGPSCSLMLHNISDTTEEGLLDSHRVNKPTRGAGYTRQWMAFIFSSRVITVLRVLPEPCTCIMYLSLRLILF